MFTLNFNMLKFFKKLSFFIAVIAIAWLCLEVFYRITPNNYTVKTNNIQTKYKDSEVLILGNSHTFYGLNPDWFKNKAFNVANVSQTLFYDQLLFTKYIPHLRNLKYVIIPVEYSSLSANDYNPELVWRSYFYESQMGLDTQIHRKLDFKKYSLALSPPFSLTVSAVKKYYRDGTLIECMPNGWASYTGVNPAYNNPAMGKIIAAKHEDNSVDFAKNTARLKKIIEVCQQKGIKVILVTMPVTTHYAVNINAKKLAMIIAQCTSIAKQHNIKYINLFSDKRFTNNDFYDTDHLNTVGAKKCSGIVNNLIAN